MARRVENVVRRLEDTQLTRLTDWVSLVTAGLGLLFGNASLPIALAAGAIGAFPVVRFVLRLWRSAGFEPLAPPSERNNPFPRSGAFKAWSRAIAGEIAERVTNSQGKRHVIVCAPTGAGKSVALGDLVPSKLGARAILIEEYDRFPGRLCEAVAACCEGKAKEHLAEAYDRLENGEGDAAAFAASAGDVLKGAPVLLVFDQAERIAAQIDRRALASRSEADELRHQFRAIFATLRAAAGLHMVFGVRDEELAAFLSILIDGEGGGESGGETGSGRLALDEVEIIAMRGINPKEDKAAWQDARKELTEIIGDHERATELVALAGRDGAERSDSLSLKLLAYLCEAMYPGKDAEGRPRAARRAYVERIHAAQHPRDLITILLDAAWEDIALQSGRHERHAFDLVLFTLAAETRATGASAPVGQVALLAHLPSDTVEPLVEALFAMGLLIRTDGDGGAHYRLAHDSIADTILRGEELELHSRAINAVRALAENGRSAQVTGFRPRPIRAFPGYLDRPALFSASYLPIVLFFVFGMVRLSFSAPLHALYARLLGPWQDYVLLSLPDYYADPNYYVPTFLVQIVWLSYIDRVNRAFIQNVTSGFKALAGNLLSLVGLAGGVVTAFSPQLLLAPLTLVATIYGVLLLWISWQPDMKGEIRGIVRKWGYRTLLNLLIATLLAICASPVYADRADSIFALLPGMIDKATALFFLILAEAAILFYFWFHIREEQNTPHVWAATLALFDKGRMREAGRVA